MKKLILVVSGVAIFVACTNPADKDTAETTSEQAVGVTQGLTYSIDSGATITWVGSKPTGKHTGIFKLKEGELIIKDNALTGGNFVIDIASLSNQDLVSDPENKGKLEGHLKSPDFFDVAKYPTATFKITSIEPYIADSSNKNQQLPGATHTIRGNLTLKDSTKNISFPAKVTIDAATASASADFKIDRTAWGMNYKGPGNPQDWFIGKEVNIQFNLNATKK